MDFDEYAASIRDANVGYILTDASVGEWGLKYIALQTCFLQIGSDGGGSIADGIVRPDTILILFQRDLPTYPICLDGYLVGDRDFCVLGPGSRFVYSCAGPRRWLGIGLRVNRSDPGSANPSIGWITGRNFLFEASIQETAGIIDLADCVEDAYERQDDIALHRLDQQLSQQCWKLLSRGPRQRHTRFDPRMARKLELVYAALEYGRTTRDTSLRVDKVCTAIGASDRSLLRACHQILGMGPKRYFMLRQLNLIRAAIKDAAAHSTNVTDLFTENGVLELGRAAGKYHRLFGELPSETRRNATLNVHAAHRSIIKERTDGSE